MFFKSLAVWNVDENHFVQHLRVGTRKLVGHCSAPIVGNQDTTLIAWKTALTLVMLTCFDEISIANYIIPLYWNVSGYWDLLKIGKSLLHTGYTLAVDDLVTRGTRAPADIVLFEFTWNIPASVPHGLMTHRRMNKMAHSADDIFRYILLN